MANLHFTPFPVLTTNRLILRPLATTDANEIWALRSDESVNKYLNRQPCPSLEAALAFIQVINENVKNNVSLYWAIALDNILIGTICLYDFSNDNTKAEIGYELLPSHQGKGLMQEAASAVLEYGFQHLGLCSIEAYTHAENKSSAKLLQRFKFIQQPIGDNNDNNDLILFRLSGK